MLFYQLVKRDGGPFGFPFCSADQMLRLVTPTVRPTMMRLGMHVVLVEVLVDGEELIHCDQLQSA